MKMEENNESTGIDSVAIEEYSNDIYFLENKENIFYMDYEIKKHSLKRKIFDDQDNFKKAKFSSY